MSDPLDLTGTGLAEAWVTELVERTLAEDLTGGAPLPSAPDLAVSYDVTSSATIAADAFGTADLVARAEGVVAGLPVAARVFARLAPGAGFEARAADGDRVARGDVLTTAMSTGVAALRSGAGLAAAGDRLDGLAAVLGDTRPAPASWEATDLLTVARALTAAATAREETRGCHWREDHPGTEEGWQVHLDVRLDDSGALVLDRRPVGTAVVSGW